MKSSNDAIRDRVVRTARELLRRHGLKGWNMDDLSREAGLAKNTLYKIIGSKESLLEQAVLTKMREDHAQIEAIIQEEKDYMTAVARMTECFADLVKNNFDYVIPSIFLEYPEIERKIRNSRKETLAALSAFIERGVEIGMVRDDMSPDFILDLVEGIVMHYYRTGLTGDGSKRPSSAPWTAWCTV
jgi:AcrR family transcriptional regulator